MRPWIKQLVAGLNERGWMAPVDPRATRRRQRRMRPALVGLEDRLAPAVITVTSLTDGPLTSLAGDGQLSLREAIQAANTDASVDGSVAGNGADTILFDPALAGQTITLTQDDGNLAFGPTALVITSEIAIEGATGGITISGNNTHRVFAVGGAATLTLESLTVMGGKAQGGAGGNGGRDRRRWGCGAGWSGLQCGQPEPGCEYADRQHGGRGQWRPRPGRRHPRGGGWRERRIQRR